MSRLASLYKQDLKTALAVIKCESEFVAHAIGKAAVVGRDYGYWQINSYHHEASALKRGFDIYDPWQNLEYGFILMKEEGLKPWSASKQCWGNKI